MSESVPLSHLSQSGTVGQSSYPSYSRERYGEGRQYSALSQRSKPQYPRLGVIRYLHLFPLSRDPLAVELVEKCGHKMQELTINRMHFGTNLERYFRRLGIKNDDIAQLVERYQLSQEDDEEIFFWRNDKRNHVLNCNVISFDKDCHVEDCHRIFGDNDIYFDLHYSFGTALFGGHLVEKERHKRVALVQEEVVALLGAYRYPQLLWVALGHGQQLSTEHLDLLKDNRVILYPDHHSIVHWQLIAEDRPNINISNFFDGQDAMEVLFPNVPPKPQDEAPAPQETPPTQQRELPIFPGEREEDCITLSEEEVPF